MKKGDIVIVHDDTPRACWKLAVINMEVNEADAPLESDGIEIPTRKASSIPDHCNHQDRHPQRASARRATDKMKEWVRLLSGPPEDVAMDEL